MEDTTQQPSNDSGSIIEWTEDEETAVRRKIDWHIVPLVTLLYMMCFLDRINIGNARIQGMATELDLNVGTRFNQALSIFYVVYLLVEVPSNIFLNRVGPRFYLPFLVCGFGLVSLCTAFVESFKGLMVARAFLGIFEGGAMPGMAFFLSCFYKRNELLLRVGIYVSAASLAGAFGGLLATGLSRIPEWGAASIRIHTWRNIFFFEGLITMLIGAVAPIWMPTAPRDAYFLTDRERHIAAERLVREHKADRAAKVTRKDLRQAVFCLHNYTCALGFFLINITVQSVSVFMPTILFDLGWTNTEAQLYSVPPYFVACLIAIAVAYASDRTKRRGIWLGAFSSLAVLGFAILRWDARANLRYMAVYFVTVGAFPGGPGFLTWGINNSAGLSVRAITSGYIVSLGTIGGIVATWTYIPADAPKYFTGHTRLVPAAKKARADTAPAPSIPSYATADCPSWDQYVLACKCASVVPTTVTAAAPSATTVTVTATGPAVTVAVPSTVSTTETVFVPVTATTATTEVDTVSVTATTSVTESAEVSATATMTVTDTVTETVTPPSASCLPLRDGQRTLVGPFRARATDYNATPLLIHANLTDGAFGGVTWDTATTSISPSEQNLYIWQLNVHNNLVLAYNVPPYMNAYLAYVATSSSGSLFVQIADPYKLGALDSNGFVGVVGAPVKGCINSVTGELTLNAAGRTNILWCGQQLWMSAGGGEDVNRGPCVQMHPTISVAPYEDYLP